MANTMENMPEIVERTPRTVVSRFARTFLLLFPVYLCGYLGMSMSWLLLAVLIWLWWKRIRQNKQALLLKAKQLSDFEESSIRSGIKEADLPAWVHFPDVERAEWLNKAVTQAWPFFGCYLEGLFKDTIEPAIRGANDYLKTLSFTKLNFGEKPPRINGVKAYRENVDKRQIIFDLHISYVGDCEIDVEIPKYFCKAGAKNVQLHGTLRVVLEPLISQMPLFGALTFFFIRRPLLHINWTGLTNLLDIPGLSGTSDTMIMDQIAYYLVLPNRFTIPIVGDMELAQIRFPIPKGVVRIHLLEARDLERKDNLLKGMIKGRSDPYAVLHVGNQSFKSKVIQTCLHPVWNEVYEAIVHEVPGQELEISVFDEDPDKDDFLGSLTVDLNDVMHGKDVDEWFDLDEVETGQLHLKLQWLSLLADASVLQEAMHGVKAMPGQANDGLSSALLIAYLDCARNLPSGKKSNLDPSPFVQLSVAHNTYESKICYNTNEPVWEQAFTFFIHNPTEQDLDIEVKDDEQQCSLGSLSIPLQKIIAADDLTLDQSFLLNQSGPNSFLKMKIALRVLIVEPPDASTLHSERSIVRRKGTAKSNKRKSGSIQRANGTASQVPSTDTSTSREYGNLGHSTTDELLGTSDAMTAGLQGTATMRLKEATPSISSDMSALASTQELRKRMIEMKESLASGDAPLGQIQLTLRHSSQRNCLVVVVHACRNLLAATDEGSDVYVRMYLLPERKKLGKKKTSVVKKSVNPTFDETFDFGITLVEAQRRVLDVAVKHNGGFLAKEELLGKLLLELTTLDLGKGTTKWYDLTVDAETLKSK
uniref:extended synaptotagmin-2-like n=1 Tax=Myxine glutinosa TaxID=7769 RepID=UPI00358F2B71